jgi:hypothetical protein
MKKEVFDEVHAMADVIYKYRLPLQNGEITRTESWSMACQAIEVETHKGVLHEICNLNKTLQEIRDHIITDKSKMPV